MAFKKRFLSILCLCLVALTVLSACNNSETPKNTDANEEPFATETDKEGNVVEIPKPTDTKVPSQRPALDFAGDPTMDGIDTSFAKAFADILPRLLFLVLTLMLISLFILIVNFYGTK